MKKIFLSITVALLFFGCSDVDLISEYERTEGHFEEDLGCSIGDQQFWRTSVKVQLNVTTDTLVKLWLMSGKQDVVLYDYDEVNTSRSVVLTAPQGFEDTLQLCYLYRNRMKEKRIPLTGKPLEVFSLSTLPNKHKRILDDSLYLGSEKKYPKALSKSRPASLCGSSISGNASYRQLSPRQMYSFYQIMEMVSDDDFDHVEYGLMDDYELVSNGPFHVTWISGYKTFQNSHILGYYYHSPGTYSDIQYVDLAETHKWDYIDSLCKVQYMLGEAVDIAGIHFNANQWYGANFDLDDYYGSTKSKNMDRIGDSVFNMQVVYERNGLKVSEVRGISFEIDIPVGMHLGFFLRSDEEPFPEQYNHLVSKGVAPYLDFPLLFRGTCFSANALNIDGINRSFIWDEGSAFWMGMEDYVIGGDNDCNDVVFCITEEMEIYKPDVISPDLIVDGNYSSILPWTLSFEDVYRNADFDFNDVVVKLEPDYKEEKCCVTLMATGSTDMMYLCYNGPNGVINFGEVHELFGQAGEFRDINTTQLQIATPFVKLDCVPWPKDYTMEQDASRFYILVKRGTCADCTDTLGLPSKPGLLPKALLVAGEWKWPIEGTSIISVYPNFSKWVKDPSRKENWNWHKKPITDIHVTY